MYPVYLNAALFKKTRDAAREGRDIELKSSYVCPVCGAKKRTT